MKNKTGKDEGSRNAAASWILAVLFVAHLLWFPVSWLGSAAGLAWENLLSVQGLRWYCFHAQDMLCTPVLSYVIPVVVLVGALERSGIWNVFRERMSVGRFQLTYRQRRALAMSGVFFCLFMGAVILSVTGPVPILLSITGEMYPSPFFVALCQSVPVGLTLSALAYASLGGHLRGWPDCLSVLYWGAARHAVWIFVTVLSVWFYEVAAYVCGGDADGGLQWFYE